MIETTASVTYGPDQPLAVLEKLVAQRAQECDELAKDALIATMINVLKSLRADTRDATKYKSIKVKVIPRNDLKISFFNKRPCVRDRATNHRVTDYRLRLAQKNTDLKSIKIFFVTPELAAVGKHKPYYCAAYSEEEAIKFETGRVKARIKQKGGLARSAFSIAMSKLHDDNAGDVTRKNRSILTAGVSQVGYTKEKSAEKSASYVEFRDRLKYAQSVLKSGARGVDIAMMKAANKTAGLITQALRRAGNIEAKIATPFPEVAKRRKT